MLVHVSPDIGRPLRAAIETQVIKLISLMSLVKYIVMYLRVSECVAETMIKLYNGFINAILVKCICNDMGLQAKRSLLTSVYWILSGTSVDDGAAL